MLKHDRKVHMHYEYTDQEQIIGETIKVQSKAKC
jgi:hypothetical protein